MLRALKPNQSARGFTLIELMVTLAVAAILTAIAMPNLRTYVLNAHRDSVVDGLVASLNYARTDALDMDQSAYVCPGITVPTSTTCPSGSWSNGWELIATPLNGTVAKQVATHALSGASNAPTFTAANASTSLMFSGNGVVTITSSSTTKTDEIFVVCDARGASSSRAVEINAAGYIQSSSTLGVAPDGTALTCASS